MLYLASQSPQRSMLLERADIAFTVIASDCDEEQIQLPHPQALAVERSLAKAKAAIAHAKQAGAQPGDIILAADTVVSLGKEVLGKPADDDDARRMLELLSDSTHTVTTAQVGITVPPDEPEEGTPLQSIQVSMTRVSMRAMSSDDIEAYIATGEHRGRAGSYAIQESGDRFVTETEGEQDTIIGLNIRAVQTIMNELSGASA